ncbi:MAG: LytTR family DNA-binding domain-containing protein [Bacilli bacterium]
MIKTAIIEDEKKAADTLESFLVKFFTENNISYSITRYGEGFSFLSECQKGFDLAFLDIEMPHMNGIEVAKKLREKDTKMALIFVTNMVQYAIRGYEVDAIDYVLKPILYTRFEALMQKTMRIIGKHQDEEVTLKTTGGLRKVFLSSILYIEVYDHLLIYHTEEGEIQVWGTLFGAQKSLPEKSFFRCNNSSIVNVEKITALNKSELTLSGISKPISISRSKKKGLSLLMNSKQEAETSLQ